MTTFADHSAPFNQLPFTSGRASREPSLGELREQWGAKLDEADAILAKAKAENRSLASDESAKVDATMAEAKVLEAKIRAAGGGNPLPHVTFQMGDGGDLPTAFQRGPQWTDSSGNPVQVVAKEQRVADLYAAKGAHELSLGNLVRAVATGDRRHAVAEFKAMSESANSGGGFMVPAEVSATVIDKARGLSAVTQAGCQFVPMTTDNLTLARVASDPSFIAHAENIAITESDVTFDAVNFNAVTVATLVRMSRELAADAPNAAMVVENAIAKALAAELDRQAIQGNAGTEFNGLLTRADITDVDASTGAIAWEDLHNAAVTVLTANYAPTAYILHPEILGDLSILTSGGGTNAAKLWLTAPPLVAPLAAYATTNCPTSGLVLGAFAFSAFGLRQGTLLEVTNSGYDAFTRHSLLIKCTWRGCFRTLQGGAFARLTGITT